MKLNKYAILFLILAFTIVAAIIVNATQVWDVNFYSYAFFTFFSFCLVAISFLKPFSFFLALTNLFFFLGFWAKTTIHMVTGSPFLEAHGEFSIPLLQSAMTESIWLLLGFLLFQFFLRKISVVRTKITHSTPNASPTLLIIFALVVLVFTLFNSYAGFLKVGLPAQVHPWFPIGPFLSWFLGPGAAFLLFLLVRDLFTPTGIFIFCMTMAAICISTLSRNSLMYFSLPFFIHFIFRWREYKKGLTYALIAFGFFSFSIIRSSQIRIDSLKKLPEKESFQDISRQKKQLLELFLDRWIGIEGVLVGVANQSDETFQTLLLEDAKVNPNSLYKKISKSDYPDAGQFLFYTFPGIFGFLSFIQSVPLKILSLLIYFMIVSCTYFVFEKYFFGLSKISASWWAASNLIQLSLFPIYNLKIFSFYILLMIIVMFGYRKFFSNTKQFSS